MSSDQAAASGSYPPRPRPRLSDEMVTVLDALIEHLEMHLDGYAAFAAGTEWKAAGPDARYEVERREAARKLGPGESWTDEFVTRALSMAVLELSVCAQLLEGLVACLRAREVLFPLAPIARSIEERLGHVGWILATGQGEISGTTRDRVARVFLAQYDDLIFQKSAGSDLRLPREVQGIVGEIRDLQDRRNRMFYPSEIAKTDGGAPILRKQQFPSVSNLNTYIGDGLNHNWNHRGVYRVLSNATHPGYRHVLRFVSVDTDGSTGWTLKDRTYVYRMIRTPLVGFGTTWEMLAAYLGHPNDEIRRPQHAFDDDPRLQGL